MSYLFRYIKNIFDVLKDKNSPFWKKFLIIFGIAYFLFPLELLPDFLLPIGFLDDIILWLIIFLTIGKPSPKTFKNNDYKRRFMGKKIVETDDYQVEEN